MDAIAELKQLIEKDNRLTKELQEKFAGLSDDYVAKDEYKKLETAVADNAAARSSAETKLSAMQTQVEELKTIAEEAATKAGGVAPAEKSGPEPEPAATEAVAEPEAGREPRPTGAAAVDPSKAPYATPRAVCQDRGSHPEA